MAKLLLSFSTLFNLNGLWNRLHKRHSVCSAPSVWWEQDAGCAALWLVKCVSNHLWLAKSCFIFTAVSFAKELLEQTTPIRAARSRRVGVTLPWAVKLKGAPEELTLSRIIIWFFFSFPFFVERKTELNVYFVVEKNTPLQSLHRNKIITVTQSCSLTVTICQRRLWWHRNLFEPSLGIYLTSFVHIYFVDRDTACFCCCWGFFVFF